MTARGRGPVRSRDGAGRPVPLGSPDAVPPVPERPRAPEQSLELARALLAADRPFYAHDVLEAAWKAAPDGERALWQALAQLCVGLTHEQRGNRVGAARLLRRGAGGLAEGSCGPAHGVDAVALRQWALEQAEQLDAHGVTSRALPL